MTNKILFVTGIIIIIIIIVHVLPGIKLPKRKQQWEEANLYFKVNFLSLPCQGEISTRASALQSMIYEYFAKTYGTIGEDSAYMATKYQNKSCKQLKKIHMDLKTPNESV